MILAGSCRASGLRHGAKVRDNPGTPNGQDPWTHVKAGIDLEH
jgi:hypothetical protein